MSSIQNAAKVVAERHMHQYEDLCRQAISKHLGRRYWDESEILARCEVKEYQDGRKILSMDRVELLEIFPPEHVIVETEFSKKMVFTSKFRFLI